MSLKEIKDAKTSPDNLSLIESGKIKIKWPISNILEALKCELHFFSLERFRMSPHRVIS